MMAESTAAHHDHAPIVRIGIRTITCYIFSMQLTNLLSANSFLQTYVAVLKILKVLISCVVLQFFSPSVRHAVCPPGH